MTKILMNLEFTSKEEMMDFLNVQQNGRAIQKTLETQILKAIVSEEQEANILKGVGFTKKTNITNDQLIKKIEKETSLTKPQAQSFIHQLYNKGKLRRLTDNTFCQIGKKRGIRKKTYTSMSEAEKALADTTAKEAQA